MNPDLFQLETIPEPPKIDPVPEGVERPLFSVMIPVYNRIKYLRQTIESVLHENYPPSVMQICIVDNSTEKIDWESFLIPEETLRIEIFRQPEHVSLGENWNTCIRQARGHLVHILHDDDWILPGFYDEISRLQTNNPSAALFATRNIFVDEGGKWLHISKIMNNCNYLSKDNADFYFTNPIQCPAIVITRKNYESLGGFLMELYQTLDWEMWHRVIQKTGFVASDKVLAAYRFHAGSDTSESSRNALNLADRLRSISIFQKRDCKYPVIEGVKSVIVEADRRIANFLACGDEEAAKANQVFRECCIKKYQLEALYYPKVKMTHRVKKKIKLFLSKIKAKINHRIAAEKENLNFFLYLRNKFNSSDITDIKKILNCQNFNVLGDLACNSNVGLLKNFPLGHFYSPIPDMDYVESHRDEIFSPQRQVLTLNLNDQGQRDFFLKVSSHYSGIPFASEKQAGLRYYFNNSFFSYGDGIALYGILREVPVKRIVEVGSGFSSALMLDVNERFLNNRIDFTFIEPFPDRFQELVENSPSKHRLLVKSVQDVELEVFASLQRDDILFIDSSHVGKIGSDFLHILFNVLPVLQSGVLIHFHDIFWPFEYPESWVKEGRAWNEIYFLRAFLAHNQDYEIVFFNSFFVEKHRDLVAEIAPLMLEKTEFDFNYPNASLWLRKR